MDPRTSIYHNVPTPSWYIFDKIKTSSAATLLEEANTDNISIGRYVLVRYCDGLLTAEQRATIEQMVETQTPINSNSLTQDEQDYYNNYKAELEANPQRFFSSQDRTVFQKIYVGDNIKFCYWPICNLHDLKICNCDEKTVHECNATYTIKETLDGDDQTSDEVLLKEINDPVPGNLAIIRRKKATNPLAYENTVYAYDATAEFGWTALDDKYGANSVYIENDISLTDEQITIIQSGDTVEAALEKVAQELSCLYWDDTNLKEEE